MNKRKWNKLSPTERALARGVAESVLFTTGSLPKKHSMWPSIGSYVLAVAIVAGLISMAALR